MAVFLGKQVPFDRVVQWTPTHDAYYQVASILASSRTAGSICITRDALVQVEAHLREAHGGDCHGLLTGRVARSPDGSVDYVVIDAIRRAPTAGTPDDSAARAARLRALISAAKRRRKVPIGWYSWHSHPLQPALEQDFELTHRLFPEPWQTTLILSGPAGRRNGAFMRIEPGDRRAYAAPFLEVRPTRRVGAGGVPLTAALWSNYRPSVEVAPLPDAEFTSATGRAGIRRWFHFGPSDAPGGATPQGRTTATVEASTSPGLESAGPAPVEIAADGAAAETPLRSQAFDSASARSATNGHRDPTGSPGPSAGRSPRPAATPNEAVRPTRETAPVRAGAASAQPAASFSSADSPTLRFRPAAGAGQSPAREPRPAAEAPATPPVVNLGGDELFVFVVPSRGAGAAGRSSARRRGLLVGVVAIALTLAAVLGLRVVSARQPPAGSASAEAVVRDVPASATSHTTSRAATPDTTTVAGIRGERAGRIRKGN